MDIFNEGFNDIIQKAEENHRNTETEIRDGIRYCKRCGMPIEIRRTVLGEERLLPIMCECEREEQRLLKEQAHAQEIADARRKCFSGDASRLSIATLAAVALEHPKEAGILRRYAQNFRELYTDQQGLLLYGTNGTGKSFAAAALCNALIEDGHEVHFTSFSRIDQQTAAGTRGDKKIYLDSLNEYALLVLDDLGAERRSEYMQELVFSVIDSRYTSGKPVVITTNLTLQDLKNPQTAQQSRIYDRILQICYPVEMTGASIRRKDTKDRYYKTKELLEG